MSKEPELKTEAEVIARFQEMRQTVNKLYTSLANLDSEAAEHDLVIKQLEPMDKGRRCYRMIGDVLVERTVGETLPAVKRNREGLQGIMQQYQQQLDEAGKALQAFQERYKIRVSQAGGDLDDDEEGEGAAAGSSRGAGGSSKKQQTKQGSAAGGKQGGAGVLC